MNMFSFFRTQLFPKLAWTSLSKQLQPARSISTKTPNDITLIGTIHSNIRQISDETIQFYFKTLNNSNNYTVHNIYMKSKDWRRHQIDPPNEGEAFVIFGNLRAIPMDGRDGKRRSLTRIKARWVYPCNTYDWDTDASQNMQMNRVDIRAQICFDIKNFEKYSILNLAHQYDARDGKEGTIFLSVFAQNEELREYVRNNLQRLDYVQVKGALQYKTFVDQKGKKQFAGSINAESITRSMRLL